jgi:hypothetical protein
MRSPHLTQYEDIELTSFQWLKITTLEVELIEF